MRCLFITLVLLISPWGSWAGPADGRVNGVAQGGREVSSDGARMAPNKDQRRADLRKALVQPQEAAPTSPEGAPVRQLSPAERAELRRQLRDLSQR